MKIHYLQHAKFETPGIIKNWAEKRGHKVTSTMLCDPSYPLDTIDLLVVMGGPMNIYEEDVYPFLKPEKKFIENVIKSGKKVLGICLGAQLVADVLGARVIRNKYKEIGWFNVNFTPDAVKFKALSAFPEDFMTFHWHGDTFEIPHGAVKIASSEACTNQGFVYDGRVYAFQFHPEVDGNSIKEFVKNDGSELVKDRYVNTGEEMISKIEYSESMNKCLEDFLEKI